MNHVREKWRYENDHNMGPLRLDPTQWGGEGAVSVLDIVDFLLTVYSFSDFSDTCVLLREQACAVKVFQSNVKPVAMICIFIKLEASSTGLVMLS